MKTLSTLVVLMVSALGSGVAHADEFDITMDVVGDEESFDEVIVNRIALPFAQSSSDRAELRDRAALDGSMLDEVTGAVDSQLSSADVGEGMDLEPMIERQDLPNVRESIGAGLGLD